MQLNKAREEVRIPAECSMVLTGRVSERMSIPVQYRDVAKGSSLFPELQETVLLGISGGGHGSRY